MSARNWLAAPDPVPRRVTRGRRRLVAPARGVGFSASFCASSIVEMLRTITWGSLNPSAGTRASRSAGDSAPGIAPSVAASIPGGRPWRGRWRCRGEAGGAGHTAARPERALRPRPAPPRPRSSSDGRQKPARHPHARLGDPVPREVGLGAAQTPTPIRRTPARGRATTSRSRGRPRYLTVSRPRQLEEQLALHRRCAAGTRRRSTRATTT